MDRGPSDTFARGDAEGVTQYRPRGLPAAVVALLATELRREDGRPLVPVVVLWLAAARAYGLYAVVNALPDRLPGDDALLAAEVTTVQTGSPSRTSEYGPHPISTRPPRPRGPAHTAAEPWSFSPVGTERR